MRKRSLKLLFPNEEARPGLRLRGKKWREPGKASKKGDPRLGCLARAAQGQRAWVASVSPASRLGFPTSKRTITMLNQDRRWRGALALSEGVSTGW